MKGLRSVGVFAVLLASFTLLSACGGGSSQLSITLTTPSGVFSVDESEPSATPPAFPTIILNAAVGGDTRNQGVTWSILKQSNTGCSGTGTGPGQCGTLTNSSAFQVTYTPPSDLSTTLSVTITATSISDPGLTKTEAISVVLPPLFTLTGCNPPSPPTNAPCILPTGNNGVPYTSSGSSQITIAFTGGVSPYSFNQPALPACLKMTVSTTAQTATISGTPCGSGQTQFTVSVTDSGGSPPVSQLYSITINPPPPLSVTTTSLSSGLTNVEYADSVVAQGGVAPLTWTLSPAPATALPPGLAFNTSTGLINGIPQPQAATGSSCTPAVAGTYCFTVQVQDSALPAHQVAPPAPLPLSISIKTPPPLQITTASLQSGMTATGYTQPLQATGGVTPYTWSLTQGQLPAGLTLVTNGDNTATISGTPIMAGDSKFTVQVTDSEAVPVSKSMTYDIVVAANTTTSTVNDVLLQGSYTFLFTGFDKNGSVIIAGTITADGKGNITSGEQDSNRISGVGGGVFGPATITGTYTIGADGRGTLELISTFAKEAPSTVDYRLVLDSSGGARFFEDNSTKTNTDATLYATHGEGVLKPVVGSGFGDASFAGNYAFLFSGQDINSKPAALGGVVHANGIDATFTPGTSDFNDNGTFSSGSASGTFAAPGNRGAASITIPIPSGQMTMSFNFYFVSPSDLYFVETDTSQTNNSPAPTVARLGGEMILQQPNVVFNDSAIGTASIVSGVGLNASNSDVFAGLLKATSCDGSTSMTLSYDENSGGTLSSPSYTGTCSMGLNGDGRVSFLFNGLTAAQTKVAAAYLTGVGQGFVLGSDAAVTSGLIEQQSGGPSFADTSVLGSYAVSAPLIAEDQVKNVIGQVVGDGNGNLIQKDPEGDTVSVIDETDPPATTAPNLDQPLAAVLGGLPSTGRGTVTTTAPVPDGFPTSGIFYIVSPGSIRMISADTTDQHPNLYFFNH